MKVAFILNNKNNRLAKVLPKLTQYFERLNLGNVQFFFTRGKKHAITLAKEATKNGFDHLIAVGGDGTLNEVINGMLKIKKPNHEYPTIGLLPYGSANDFARTAQISNSIEKLIELIQTKTIQEIDLGKISIHHTKETRYFINIAGIGLGPEVVLSLEQSSSVLGPSFNYFMHIVKKFLSYEKKEMSCKSSNWQWKGKLLQMAVANGKFFGNAINIAPDAQLDDGLFQVVIFGELSIWHYLKNLGKLKNGVKIKHTEVHYHYGKELLLESMDSCAIEADGEYVGLAPASVSILPKAIRFLIPPEVV
jgi:YegS/Rv2252/BmrU family lipid kinase